MHESMSSSPDTSSSSRARKDQHARSVCQGEQTLPTVCSSLNMPQGVERTKTLMPRGLQTVNNTILLCNNIHVAQQLPLVLSMRCWFTGKAAFFQISGSAALALLRRCLFNQRLSRFVVGSAAQPLSFFDQHRFLMHGSTAQLSCGSAARRLTAGSAAPSPLSVGSAAQPLLVEQRDVLKETDRHFILFLFSHTERTQYGKMKNSMKCLIRLHILVIAVSQIHPPALTEASKAGLSASSAATTAAPVSLRSQMRTGSDESGKAAERDRLWKEAQALRNKKVQLAIMKSKGAWAAVYGKSSARSFYLAA